MIHQLSGGAWGVVIRRPLGAATRVAAGARPCCSCRSRFGMHDLYEWTHADVVAHDAILQHKQPYLNMPFFLVRAAFYFAVWNALVVLPEHAGRSSRTAPAIRASRAGCRR